MPAALERHFAGWSLKITETLVTVSMRGIDSMKVRYWNGADILSLGWKIFFRRLPIRYPQVVVLDFPGVRFNSVCIFTMRRDNGLLMSGFGFSENFKFLADRFRIVVIAN
ncbi:hypothetical protein [Pseudomonas paraeruginosa]|uniref:hypothetical protein n=1 Tax=Pseudomonas paraeruginosa TaxID=2994495 RepID=UPI001A271216|nr:hypothetical protein [Pseudomonas aeruginosa]